MTSVSFQGERGAYSEAAAKSFFDDNIQTIPLPTFSDILQNTSKNISEYAILPVENSSVSYTHLTLPTNREV